MSPSPTGALAGCEGLRGGWRRRRRQDSGLRQLAAHAESSVPCNADGGWIQGGRCRAISPRAFEPTFGSCRDTVRKLPRFYRPRAESFAALEVESVKREKTNQMQGKGQKPPRPWFVSS